VMKTYRITITVDGVVEECLTSNSWANCLGFEHAIMAVTVSWEQSGHVVGDVLKVEVMQ
jgi:hypothetical protein